MAKHTRQQQVIPDFVGIPARKPNPERGENGVIYHRFRTLFPQPSAKSILHRACEVLWPWGYRQYPGVMRLRAWLVDVPVATGATYGKIPLPKSRVKILLAKLVSKRDELDRMIFEVQALLDAVPKKDASPKPVIAPPPD